MARLLIFLATLLAFVSPARADDISATGRGVVRVVTIAIVDDEVAGFGHGSGFAVAPNRIVTNAHVVELAARYPQNVLIGVVPSEGSKSYQGRVVAYDPQRDLAMIEFEGARLPVTTLYTGPTSDGESVIALGYPGNVDVATAQSAADYINPLSPVRSQGVFSGRRNLAGAQVLLHTASIARGNSGGPLLDACGRVIGVNSAITRTENGDSTFGFAIADTELAAFLRQAQQPYQSVGTPCTSIEQRLAQDEASALREREDSSVAAHDRATEAALANEQARADALAAEERMVENFMALAAVLLVFGALALGGAGLFEVRGERQRAIWFAAGGAAMLVAAAAVFFSRPDGKVTVAAMPSGTMPKVDASADFGKMTCSFLSDRSRVTVSSTDDVPLEWHDGGCVNGRTQYAEDGAIWDRILVPSEEQTVSTLAFDPATRIYTNTRYLLSADQMEAVRKLRAQIPLKACTKDPTARADLATQQQSIRAALPPLPNEKLVYHCTPATTGAGGGE